MSKKPAKISADKRARLNRSLMRIYGPYCQLCLESGWPLKIAKIDMTSEYGPRSWSIDHKIPRSKGGTNRLINLWPAHRKCNNEKGDEL